MSSSALLAKDTIPHPNNHDKFTILYFTNKAGRVFIGYISPLFHVHTKYVYKPLLELYYKH
jgi:hypothetical protein